MRSSANFCKRIVPKGSQDLSACINNARLMSERQLVVSMMFVERGKVFVVER